MHKIIGIFFVLLIIPPFAAGGEEGGKIFKQKCGQCHPLERAMMRERNLPAWKSTTLRMARYSRGTISSDEAGKVAEYLSGLGMTDARDDYAHADDGVSPLKIEATLKYRSASQSLVKTLLGESAPQIPVVDMVTITEKIEI